MAKPPVAKLMDFGKFKYEAAIKAREARKNQVNTVIKEIKLRPKIDPHDYGTKKGHVERFLKAGDKVKVTIMFRGREQSRPELGFRLLQRLAEDVGELGFVECTPKQDGRNMIMVLGPTKKKAEAKAEQAARTRARPPATGRRRPREPPGPAEPAAPSTAAHRSAPTHGSPDGPAPGRAAQHRAPGASTRPGGHAHDRRVQPRTRTSARPNDGEIGRHAEDEDAQRRQEALPDHRQRQGHARAGRRPPPARAQVLAAAPARSPSDVEVAQADAKKIKKLLGQLSRPTTIARPGSVSLGSIETARSTHVARVKRAVNAQKKRRVVLERASGYRGQRSRLYRKAKEQVTHSPRLRLPRPPGQKGDFRRLWIQRINAGARANGMTYNRFIQGLKAAEIEVDRRMLAELAVNDAAAFTALVEIARAHVPAQAAASADAQRGRLTTSRLGDHARAGVADLPC